MDDNRKSNIFAAIVLIPIAIDFTFKYIMYTILLWIVTAKLFFNGKATK